jgi:hypothetical protein
VLVHRYAVQNRDAAGIDGIMRWLGRAQNRLNWREKAGAACENPVSTVAGQAC